MVGKFKVLRFVSMARMNFALPDMTRVNSSDENRISALCCELKLIITFRIDFRRKSIIFLVCVENSWNFDKMTIK